MYVKINDEKEKHMKSKIKLNKTELTELIKKSVNMVLEEYIDNQPLRVEDYFDINSISKKDIMSIANDLTAFIPRMFGSPISDDGELMLDENVNVTMPIGQLRKELKKFGFKQWQIKSAIVANKVRVLILYADINKNTNVIENEMLLFGWSKAKISQPVIIQGITCRVMEFDPMIQKPITKEARKFEYLYHLTPQSNVLSILKNGIEPRSENDYLSYPPKAHLLKGNISQNIASYVGWQLFHVKKGLTDGNYALLRIETNKLPENIEFYKDPRFEYGYYSNGVIPSSAIEVFGKIEYTDKEHFNNEQITFLKNNTMFI